MATLRLFANLREAAGTNRADFPGQTVGEVLNAARTAYGDDFSKNMEIAKVGGGTISLPGEFAGGWGVVLLYRGHW